MLESVDHGTAGLAFGYALAVVGLVLGLKAGQAPLRRFIWTPVLAIPTLLGAAVLWSVALSLGAQSFKALSPTATELFGMVFVVVASGVAGLAMARAQPGTRHHRGTRLVDSALGGIRVPGGRTELSFAGCPVPEMDETKHFKLLGTTGTGKSTAIRHLLRDAIARGDRAVIADPDGSYLETFFDTQRGDVILNPFHDGAARWDLFAEVIQPHDADQLARSLIPDHDGSDRNWRNYARTFLTAVLRQLHRVNEQDVARLYYLLVMAPAEELRELLEATPAGPFLGQDNGRFFESVRSVGTTHLSALEHIARQSSGRALSVRRWVREGRGVLFLPYRASEVAALRNVISTWMRLAIFEAMNANAGDQRLWFVVDELDALGAIDGLKDALARLRKFGGRCVLGFQSIAQVRGTYGEAEAQTIVENCGNTLILRSSASERGGTAEFASRLIGKREIIRQQRSHSRPTRWGGGLRQTRTLSEQHTVEDAVMASEIEQLADLEGFLKIASRPEWRRVKL
ncbi:MAG TPA: type IV secretion system DNA-binding domain-containing protein [Steroidobacteraceae bacterium]|nr:type IV secretion system DNA-binding domain-containing protein [Steroidobacteraceae bacterium]